MISIRKQNNTKREDVNNLAFNYSKLRGRIKEKFGSEKAFAEAMAMKPSSLSSRLNQGTSFSQTEIIKASFLLDVDKEKLADYFFKELVQKTEQNY